jgi:hypothetical protein
VCCYVICRFADALDVNAGLADALLDISDGWQECVSLFFSLGGGSFLHSVWGYWVLVYLLYTFYYS